MMNIKEKRIISEVNFKGNESYHHFILKNDDNKLILLFQNEYLDKIIAEEKMRKISFPMEYIPQFIGIITGVFYSTDRDKTYLEIKYDNSSLFAFINIDERNFEITELKFGKENLGQNQEGLMWLRWPKFKFILNDPNRIMPASLVWLIDNLKELYNEWQKKHPEYPPIDD